MKIVLIIWLIFLLIFTVSCSKKSNTGHSVKYKIGGSSKMDVTYTDASLIAKTVSGVDASWTYTFNTTATGHLVRLVVTSVDGTAVNAAIYMDGQQSTQNNSSGGTVSISAQIP